MEREGFGSEARAAKGGGRGAGACDVEAAEALAGLSWCSASCGGAVSSGELKSRRETGSQDKLMGTGQFNSHAPSIRKIEKIAKTIPRGRPSNPMRRPKLTEAERQARHVRRILANREAARRTIKRRQAKLLDLTRKAAAISKENENLKKEKLHVVEEYKTLKRRNEFLKAQLSKTKRAKPRDSQDSKNSWSNQLSMVPCFWPPIYPPPPNLFKPQCVVAPPQFPLFSYPVPWLFPFFAQGTPPYSYPTKVTEDGKICSKCSCLESSPPEKSNSHLSTKLGPQEMAASSSKKSMSGPGPTFPTEITGDKKSTHWPGLTVLTENCSDDASTVRNEDGTIFVPGLFSRVRPQEKPGPTGYGANRESTAKIEMRKVTEGACSKAAEARRKRKMLMKMKSSASRRQANARSI